MDIARVYPYNRNIKDFYLKDGTHMMEVHTVQNPIYYLNPSGVLLPIDIASKSVEKVNGGDSCLRKASVASVGFKVADDAYKYLGLRPDCVQDGTEQLEFSIVKIEFDGKSQTIDLSGNTAKSSILTEIGPLVYVQSTRQRTRQLVKVSEPVSSFKIVYQLDVTGLQLVDRKDLDEFWFYSKRTKDFRFRICKPYLVGIDGNPHPIRKAVKHSLVANKDGTYTYTKENTVDLSEVKAPYFIDADTVYSTTADGHVIGDGLYNESPSTAWSTSRNTTTGTKDDNDATETTAVGVNATGETLYYIHRAFFYFPLASVTQSILAATVGIYGTTNSNCNVCVQQGTQQDTLDDDDINNFSGNSWGNTSSWNASAYNTITLDSTGIAAANTAAGSMFKVCARDYTYDYANNRPTADKYSGMYFADETGTTKDPYLLITLGPANVNGINGLAPQYVKTLNDLAFSSVKTLSGL